MSEQGQKIVQKEQRMFYGAEIQRFEDGQTVNEAVAVNLAMSARLSAFDELEKSETGPRGWRPVKVRVVVEITAESTP